MRCRLIVLLGLSLFGPSACQHPSQTPRDILFVRMGAEEPGYGRLYRMGVDGSDPRLFVSDTVELGASNVPDWSPDGARALFISQASPRTLALFVAEADGTGVAMLQATDEAFHEWPAWSPSGEQILFNAGPSPFEQDLYVMNVDGSAVRRLTESPGREYCGRWAPEGTRVVYTTMSDDTIQLFILDLEGGLAEPALPSGFEAECADWSPDGRRLAFSSPPDHDFPSLEEMMSSSPVHSIYVLDLDSGSVEQLTHLAGASARPRWSPDGSRIVFHSTESVGTVPASDPRFQSGMEIYVINADGSALQRLTRNDVWDGHPVW